MSRNAKQFGYKCGMTGKRRFKSKAHADKRAAEIKLHSHHCNYCDGWHLTKERT